MTSAPEDRDEVAEAARVLSALGLVTAYGHVSARTGTAMLITPAADLARSPGHPRRGRRSRPRPATRRSR